MDKLENLDITKPEEIDSWHERFEYYCTFRKVKHPNVIPFYLTWIGKPAYNLLKDLAYPNPVHAFTVQQLQQMLKQHIQSSNYTTVQRAKFHNLMRNKGESFRSFMLRLQQQASRCNFNADLPTQLRDRIVAGVQDKEVTKRLLREGDALTYAAARKILEDWDQVNDAVEVTTHLRDSEVLYTKHKQHYTQRRNTGVRHRDLPSSSKNANKPSGNDQGAAQSYGSRLQRKCNSCGGDHPRYTCRFRKVICHN